MEPPSLAEEIRRAAEGVARLERAITTFVTQQEFAAYKELQEERRRTLLERQEDDEARWRNQAATAAANRRLALSAFIAPVIVGLIVWLITEGIR